MVQISPHKKIKLLPIPNAYYLIVLEVIYGLLQFWLMVMFYVYFNILICFKALSAGLTFKIFSCRLRRDTHVGMDQKLLIN